MSKIYLVRSFFEDFDTSSNKIIGIFTDQKMAQEVSEKWSEFYETKQKSILEKPKNWQPDERDLEIDSHLGTNCEWEDSIEYSKRMVIYREIINFREITIDELELNQDISLKDEYINDNLMSLMIQWDRNFKLNKLV